MKNKAFNVSAHAFSAGDQILPDANIWLYLYSPATMAYPQWLKNEIAPYSSAWNNVYANGAKVFLDTMVFSEVINRLLDDEWTRIDPNRFTTAKRYRNRKAFRLSAEYPPAAKAVESIGRQIMGDSTPIDHPFSKWDLNVLLSDFGSGSKDWNDQLILENCKKQGLKLMTHDKDYTHGGIEVLTANQKLIAACPP